MIDMTILHDWIYKVYNRHNIIELWQLLTIYYVGTSNFQAQLGLG